MTKPMVSELRNFKWPFRPAGTLALVLAIVLGSAAWLGAIRLDPEVFRENGPMENFQVACLLVGILFLVTTAFRSPLPEHRVLFAGVTLVYLTIVVLEVDLREFDLPTINRFFNGRPRDVWLGSLWLVGLFFFSRRARAVLIAFLKWVQSPAGTLFLLSAGFWIAGTLVDKLKPFGSGKAAANLMTEELTECHAALLMIASAVLTWKRDRTSRNL